MPNPRASCLRIASKRLDSLGFVWGVPSPGWNVQFQRLQAYKDAYGDVLVPFKYTTTESISLGFWVRNQRFTKSKGQLSEGRIRQLDSLGFVWDVLSHEWNVQFQRLQAYKDIHGDVLVPRGYKTGADGADLPSWVSTQRFAKSKGTLSEDRIRQLDSLGFVWDVPSHKWNVQFQRLQAYKDIHGDVLVPRGYKTGADGADLPSWVSTQRFAKSKGTLSEGRIRQLDSLGFVWDVLSHEWNVQFQRLQAYKDIHGDVLVPRGYKTADGADLGSWVNYQRFAKSKGQLSEGRIRQLDSLGFAWKAPRQLGLRRKGSGFQIESLAPSISSGMGGCTADSDREDVKERLWSV